MCASTAARQLFARRSKLIFPKIERRSNSRSTSTYENPQNRRLNKIIARLPRRLQPYTVRLRDAPIAHIIAFLMLHEVTAIVPLVGLTQLFHITGWIPKEIAEMKYLDEGLEKFGLYFRKKGWFGFGEAVAITEGDTRATSSVSQVKDMPEIETGASTSTIRGKQFLVEVAAAYAVTKLLLPARIIISVWATPWFASFFITRIGSRLGKYFGRGGK